MKIISDILTVNNLNMDQFELRDKKIQFKIAPTTEEYTNLLRGDTWGFGIDANPYTERLKDEMVSDGTVKPTVIQATKLANYQYKGKVIFEGNIEFSSWEDINGNFKEVSFNLEQAEIDFINNSQGYYTIEYTTTEDESKTYIVSLLKTKSSYRWGQFITTYHMNSKGYSVLICNPLDNGFKFKLITPQQPEPEPVNPTFKVKKVTFFGNFTFTPDEDHAQ